MVQVLGVDTDSMTVVDSEEAEPCVYTVKKKPCGRAAAWAVLTTCCGTAFLFCQQHFDRILDRASFEDGFRCDRCGSLCRPAIEIFLAATKIER